MIVSKKFTLASLIVAGVCTCVPGVAFATCTAAPAVANSFLHLLEMGPGGLFNIIARIATLMGPGTSFGDYTTCDTEYQAAVTSYIVTP